MDSLAYTFLLFPYKESVSQTLIFLPNITLNSFFKSDLRVTASDIWKNNVLVVLSSL